jgi:hypothetical protein
MIVNKEKGMFEIIFGIFWMLTIAPMAIMALLDGDMGPIVFLLPFLIAGIWLLYSGIKKVTKNAETHAKGTPSYGLVVDFSETGTYINGHAVWNAHILAIADYGLVREFKEEVGTRPKFDVGDFVSIKYYQDDINVTGRVNLYAIPEQARNVLQSASQRMGIKSQLFSQPQQPQDFIVRGDTIIIDGIEYKRPT